MFNRDKLVSESANFLDVLSIAFDLFRGSYSGFNSLFCACVGKVKGSTVGLIFDGEAEDVPGPEASAVVHSTVEERVGVGVLNVQDLTCGGHVTRNPLICRDTELLL